MAAAMAGRSGTLTQRTQIAYEAKVSLGENTMRQRVRKFWGAILLLILVAVWSLLAMAFATFGALHETGGLVEFAYYVVAGVGWTLPAGAIIWWMVRPDRVA